MITVDDFLIDRVFQRISDALWRLGNCYDMASFWLTGALLSEVVADTFQRHWVFLATLVPFYAVYAARAYYLSWRYGDDTILPMDRIRDHLYRCIILVLCCGEIVRAIFIGVDIGSFVVFQFLIGLYFLACRPSRPKSGPWWLGYAPARSSI